MRIAFIPLLVAMLPVYGQNLNEELGLVAKDLGQINANLGIGLGGGQGYGIGIGQGVGQGYAFQTFGNPVLSGVRVLDEGFGRQTVKNKPFSATEERHFLQTLGDGTRIENTQTNRLYRDSEGRTRVEEMNGTVTIFDPVARVRIELDPAKKTARKQNGAFNFVSPQVLSGYAQNSLFVNAQPGNAYSYVTRTDGTNTQGVMSETTENLGTQQVNGVASQGLRTTMIIPKGQIGNSKDIKVMTERWSSNDLQMLVKSVNSDPRFGDTTYQLTKIAQNAPDAALFQVPSDYAVTDTTSPAGLQPLKRLATPPAARGVAPGVK